jgi:myo-inositol-1(or 4)-monophosphatase
VAKASTRIEESILSDLQLVRPSAGLLTPNVSKAGDGRDEFVLALSGAANFVRGNAHFAISLALRSNGETKIALVYSPIDERLYYAEKDNGAYVFSAFHSEKIRVSNLKEPIDLTIGYNTRGIRPIIAGDARETGCVALDLAWVAAGKFDAFISDPVDFAEMAAGELLVREAGGKIFDNGGDLIATNGNVEL